MIEGLAAYSRLFRIAITTMLRPVARRGASLRSCGLGPRPLQRPFCATPLRSQQLPGENERTTHFGFETIAEAQKEGRGIAST